MTKTSRNRVKRRHFFLFNDALMWGTIIRLDSVFLFHEKNGTRDHAKKGRGRRRGGGGV